jgi:hypothetical protein
MSDRPPTRNTTEEFLDALSDLRDRIVRFGTGGDRDSDMLRKYDYFVKNGLGGRDCQYTIKSRSQFFKEDCGDIMKLVEQVYLLYQEIK